VDRYNAVWGDSLYPFLDQNQMTHLQIRGKRIVFKTTNGEKIYDPAKNTWDYEVKGVPTPAAPLPAKGGPESVVYGIPVASSGNPDYPDWKLDWTPGEDGIPTGFKLTDLKTGRQYPLPAANYIEFVVYRRHAWILSGYRIFSLDLDTNQVTCYVTWPLFPSGTSRSRAVIIS
jgi:hypothetical protein